MGSEISQFDIPNRQLLAIKSQSRMDMRTDIGEAKITHTIFGRAKIRVIRERDKTRRVWLWAMLVVTVVAAASWQGWTALQQMQNAVLSPSETVRVTAPVFQPEYVPLPDLSPSKVSKPGTPPQAEISDLMSSLKNMPQSPSTLQPTVPMAATPQPLVASKPQTDKQQTAPPATNNSPAKSQAVAKQPPKPLPPKSPVAPVVAKPSAVQPIKPTVATPPAAKSVAPAVTQPATTKPADVAPLVQPSSKETTQTPLPAITNQSLAPVNGQPQTNTKP